MLCMLATWAGFRRQPSTAETPALHSTMRVCRSDRCFELSALWTCSSLMSCLVRCETRKNLRGTTCKLKIRRTKHDLIIKLITHMNEKS
jgi:hypothetical protein